MSAAHSHPGQRGLLNPPPQRLDPDRPAEPPSRVDPLELMETAARNHWRAAAWLLERTRPEVYGRKSASAAPRRQVEAALLHVLAAALETAAPPQRDQIEAHVFAACQRAFASCFPAVAALSPLDLPADAMLSPITHEATEWECREELNHDGTTADNAEPVVPPSNAAEACSASPAGRVSPKIANATEFPATEMPATVITATELAAAVESPPAAVPESQVLSLQRHAALRRREQLQSRKRQAAAKRQKRAAKKQARAARRRAA